MYMHTYTHSPMFTMRVHVTHFPAGAGAAGGGQAPLGACTMYMHTYTHSPMYTTRVYVTHFPVGAGVADGGGHLSEHALSICTHTDTLLCILRECTSYTPFRVQAQQVGGRVPLRACTAP